MKHCPECNSPIDVDLEDLDDGDFVDCTGCGEELEVVFLDSGGMGLQSVWGDESDDSEDDWPQEREGVEWDEGGQG